jgi:hypothetical protein
LAIIAQNRLGAWPKNGISFEGITILLEKILAKTPNPKLLQSIPEKTKRDYCTCHHALRTTYILYQVPP